MGGHILLPCPNVLAKFEAKMPYFKFWVVEFVVVYRQCSCYGYMFASCQTLLMGDQC